VLDRPAEPLRPGAFLLSLSQVGFEVEAAERLYDRLSDKVVNNCVPVHMAMEMLHLFDA